MAVIDPLMRVGEDEDVIWAWLGQRAQQPPLRRVQILPFIHNDVGVPARTRGDDRSVVCDLQMGATALACKVADDALYRGPDLITGLGSKRTTTTTTRSVPILLHCGQLLSQDHLFPLTLQESAADS